MMRSPRALKRIQLFPAQRGKFLGVLIRLTLNNCFIN